MTLAACMMGTIGESWAYTLTLQTSTGGKFRYRISDDGGSTWNSWSSYFTSDQSVTVADGKYVQIAAYPRTDISGKTYYFTKWTGYETVTTYAYSFTVNQNRTYKCNFTETGRTVNLSINTANYGTVKISGPFATQTISTTSNTTVTVGNGATITLTATPASNKYFVNYTGTSTQTTYVYTRTVTANCSYKANFTTEYKTIKISVNANNWGTAKLSGPVADKSTTTTTGTSVNVGVGATISLTGTPATGKYWVRWKEDDANAINNASSTYVVADNRDLVATFTETYYTMTVKSNGDGYVRIHNGASWSNYVTTTAGISIVAGEGARCTVAAYDPNTTYGSNQGTNKYFVDWKEGTDVASVAYSYGFDVESARTLTGYFTTSSCAVTVNASPSAGGTVRIGGALPNTAYSATATATVGRGATITMANSPAAGYILGSWTKDSATGTVLGYANSCTTVVPNSETASYYANFTT